MHYMFRHGFSATSLLLSIACGHPEPLTPVTRPYTDTDATYAIVESNAQESNIVVVTHISNNAQGGGNQVVVVADANAPAKVAPTQTPPPEQAQTSTTNDANTLAQNTPTLSNTNTQTQATPTPDVTPTPTPTPTPTAQATADTNNTTSNPNTVTATHLIAQGNHLVWNDGTPWMGRGANIQDARGCGACVQTDLKESTQEVLRRIDALTDDWHANFLRLTLESDSTPDILQNPNYLASVATIVAHVMQKPNVVLEVSLWIDPSFNSMGWPTAQTGATWKKLVSTLGQYPRVMFGIVNEPQYNSDGSLDANVWSAMNSVAQQIRDQERDSNFIQHVVIAQGTGGWSRYLQYYTSHPLTAGNGNDFAYEVHVYDAASTFNSRFVSPSASIPVIIGEFGPADGAMTLQDCTTLMNTADALGVPYMGWTAHMRCPPSMLEDNSEGSCGIGMPLDPTPWGQLLIDRLASNVAGNAQ